MPQSTSKPIIYLDHAATSFPKPEVVYREADEFYRRYGGNAGRGSNPLARIGAELISETRSLLAEWLGISAPEHVILTPSATIALNQLILGSNLRFGDVVYLTPFEHNAVLRPVGHLQKKVGIEIVEIPFDRSSYTCDLEQLATKFRIDPPTLVCITQASNVCGVMPPVMEIARLAKESNPNAIVIVDGAQAAGLYPIDLQGGPIDALVFSGHKSMYGPYGVAGFVLASDWRPGSVLFGGTGVFSEELTMPNELPFAYEAGSHNIWAIAGLRAAQIWLRETERKNIVNHVNLTTNFFREEISNIPEITIHAPPTGEPCAGIISFTFEGIRPQGVEALLGSKGIVVRAGLHCAPMAHNWLGTLNNGGTVRVSFGHTTTKSDVSKAISTLNQLSGRKV